MFIQTIQNFKSQLNSGIFEVDNISKDLQVAPELIDPENPSNSPIFIEAINHFMHKKSCFEFLLRLSMMILWYLDI